MSGSSSNKVPLVHGSQIVTCPHCRLNFKFYRSSSPHIDECGFENYRLECLRCDARLYGIIDPADGKLLLSGTELQNKTRHVSSN